MSLGGKAEEQGLENVKGSATECPSRAVLDATRSPLVQPALPLPQVTLLLVVNNALQGILSSFFFKFADTILKKYSSTIATIFTGVMSAALFGHPLTLNFCIGVSIVFISMHLFFSTGASGRQGHACAWG